MRYKCICVKNKIQKHMFLNLPSLLYDANKNPQNIKIEKQILNGTHPLSKDIEVHPFIVVNQNKQVICRCILTYYKNDPVAYLGFFESFNNPQAVRRMMYTVKEKAQMDGKTKIIGPIDASIYINYRFKTNNFDKTYTSEPYNKPYYVDLWLNNDFYISDKYVSNQLRKIEKSDNDERIQKIYNRLINKGFTFVNPTKSTFSQNLSDVYDLMMELYSDFSGYKKITKEQFLKIYSPLKNVLNFDMVKLAYKNNELCAFCICIPNYNYLTRGKLNIMKLFKINKIKKKPDEYVILYLGASAKSVGLGVTLIQQIKDALYQNQCTSIGALIKEGNITGELYKDLYVDQYNYVLMSYDL